MKDTVIIEKKNEIKFITNDEKVGIKTVNSIKVDWFIKECDKHFVQNETKHKIIIKFDGRILRRYSFEDENVIVGLFAKWRDYKNV